jgi:hypothetical protein
MSGVAGETDAFGGHGLGFRGLAFMGRLS